MEGKKYGGILNSDYRSQDNLPKIHILGASFAKLETMKRQEELKVTTNYLSIVIEKEKG